MRVIAGSARGLRLAAPKDPRTRPISDKVKESLFGVIGSRVVGARVLDLYAGSGAIGIEALSRGASLATFVERGRPAVAVIRENLERTGLAERAEIHAVIGRGLPRARDGAPAGTSPSSIRRTRSVHSTCRSSGFGPISGRGRWSWSSISGGRRCRRPANWRSSAAGDSAKRH